MKIKVLITNGMFTDEYLVQYRGHTWWVDRDKLIIFEEPNGEWEKAHLLVDGQIIISDGYIYPRSEDIV